jgi:hypothetical protein
MQNRSKGALAMVLAGAVTFSVTNSFLPEPMTRIANELALHVSGDAKKADIIRKQETAIKEQSAIMNGEEGQTKLSDGPPVVQKTKNEGAGKAHHQNIKSTATNQARTNETTTESPSAAIGKSISSPAGEAKQPSSSAPAVSPKAPAASVESKPTSTKNTSAAKQPAEAAKPATSTKKTVSTNPSLVKKTTNKTTTPTNRGQEVSQSAKEKAADNREQKGNSRK